MFDRAFRAIVTTLLAALAVSVTAAEAPRQYRIQSIAQHLSDPWSLVFLPGGEALLTERTAGLRVLTAGLSKSQRIAGVPRAFIEGDGGYLGLALHPNFKSNRYVYVCMSVGTSGANASSVIRGRLGDARLEDIKTVFTAFPMKSGPKHFGCRLAFAPDGKLFVTLGDGYNFPYQAQALDNDLGKVIRLNDDGSIPQDNPFVRRWKAQGEIYTYGHRNVQGIAMRPGTNEVWIHEHGPKGGDEVNILRAGANYGWPMITYGVDYSGATVSELSSMPGMEQPVIYWVPSIAPSGMDFYSGNRFPKWQGDLFVGALAGKHLRRLHVVDQRIMEQEVLLAELKKRIREVRSAPDGYLYVLTDGAEGSLLRLEPAT